MQNSFYAFAIPRFAALAAEVCKPTRTCHTGGNGNESNREEGKRANDRARLIRECSYSMASAPWPAFSFTSSIFSSAWGGKEMPWCCLQTLESPARSSFPMDGCEQRGDASRISVSVRFSLKSAPLTLLLIIYLIFIAI